MVRQLTVADLRGEDATLLSPEEIKNKLSKELIDALDKMNSVRAEEENNRNNRRVFL